MGTLIFAIALYIIYIIKLTISTLYKCFTLKYIKDNRDDESRKIEFLKAEIQNEKDKSAEKDIKIESLKVKISELETHVSMHEQLSINLLI